MTSNNQEIQSDQELPIAAVAYYGPDDKTATKVVVAIIDINKIILESKEWISAEQDIRYSQDVSKEMALFIANHHVSRVIIAEGIIGCPHKAGIDFPEGEVCPYCPYWVSQEK